MQPPSNWPILIALIHCNMAEAAADKVGLTGVARDSFMEVYAALGPRGAKSYEQYLAKVRSKAEVVAKITELGLPTSGNECDRLVFCGRYAAKAGTPLEEALETAMAGISAAAELKAALGESNQLSFALSAGRWGEEHKAARAAAFPYSPSVSATHGSDVIEARTTAAVMGTSVQPGQLLGYVAMQSGGYVDDIAVFPAFQGHGVASALIAGAASVERGSSMSLDVRAANVPAIKLYTRLGFRFGQLQHPSFLDWDGGFEGEADVSTVRRCLPSNADLSALLQ